MAYHAALSSVLGELIVSLVAAGLPARERKLRTEHAVQLVRGSHRARTDQFAVKKSCEGLLEKFQILHREDLAGELSERLRRLEDAPHKLTPEILALLLALSDRPVEKTHVADLERLVVREAPAELTWADIVAEEPFTEEGVWDDIDYAAHGSSDDDEYEEELSSPEDLTSSSVGGDSLAELARSFIVQPVPAAVRGLEESQARLRAVRIDRDGDLASQDAPATVTELMVIREAIMMLRGLPSTLFTADPVTSDFQLAANVSLRHTSTKSVTLILEDFVRLANSLQALRRLTHGQQSQPLLQTFQTEITDRLLTFSRHLTNVELALMKHSSATVISLASTRQSVLGASEILQELALVTSSLPVQDSTHECLELLYKRACLAQMAGNREVFTELGRMFFSCLATYLRPLRTWMEDGVLSSSGQEFLITASTADGKPDDAEFRSLVLKCTADGSPSAPHFLHPFCARILNAGRTVRLMRRLDNNFEPHSLSTREQDLHFPAVYDDDAHSSLQPFSESVSVALADWVARHHSYSSTTLRARLIQQGALWRSFDAIEYLYLARDGSVIQAFADAISERLDQRRGSWIDRFFVSDLLKALFEANDAIDTDAIVVLTSKQSSRASKLQRLASITVVYTLHWSIETIVPRSSLSIYQKLLSLRLQLCHLASAMHLVFLDAGATKLSDSDVRHTGALRFHLHRFASVLQDYISGTVDMHTKHMRQQIDRAGDIDEMAQIHDTYIKRLEKQVIISKSLHAIRSAIMQVLELCHTFCDTYAEQTGLRDARRAAQKRHRRRRSALLSLDEHSDDENLAQHGDDEHEDYPADVESQSTVHVKYTGAYGDRVHQMGREFDKLNSFIIHGLRGIAKAGDEPCYEMLAERLE